MNLNKNDFFYSEEYNKQGVVLTSKLAMLFENNFVASRVASLIYSNASLEEILNDVIDTEDTFMVSLGRLTDATVISPDVIGQLSSYEDSFEDEESSDW